MPVSPVPDRMKNPPVSMPIRVWGRLASGLELFSGPWTVTGGRLSFPQDPRMEATVCKFASTSERSREKHPFQLREAVTVIFLDIDGVLVPTGDDIPTYPVFLPRCVDALKSVLAAVPTAKVVFSSTWRLPAHVSRLHAQWKEHDFPESLAMDGTPDLRDHADVPRLHRRGLEIQRWLSAHPEVSRWVVIDDDRSAIEGVLDGSRCLFTVPDRGMTLDDAERAVAILQGARL